MSGLVQELRATLERYATPPVALVGASWGAWLGLLLAARHPSLVRKLIMVGSGPFEAEAAAQITATRLARLSEADRQRAYGLLAQLETPLGQPKDQGPAPGADPPGNAAFGELGTLLSKADAYAGVAHAAAPDADLVAFQRVWPEAAELRRSGRLLSLAAAVRCPVVAVHGDYDPHPAEGVRRPLAEVVRDFRFVLLERCGHEPWNERYARDRFFEVLRAELR